MSRGSGCEQRPVFLTATQTHSEDKALAFGTETKVRLDLWNNWKSLESGAWGKLPYCGKTTHISYDSVLSWVLLKALFLGHVAWGTWHQLGSRSFWNFKQLLGDVWQNIVTKWRPARPTGVLGHGKYPHKHNGNKHLLLCRRLGTKGWKGHGVPPQRQPAGRKMELGALCRVTCLLTQAQHLPPSSGLHGFHSEITIFTDRRLRGSLKNHCIVGYWGYFQQGGDTLSLNLSVICLPTLVIGNKVTKSFTARSHATKHLGVWNAGGKVGSHY